ncbi:DUF309 domain-containing protein [Pleurocapsa sp. FMAR1]|uniref:DUF309 domain-containing protein n=1 Tax=Pleurocapsa sp. FMAR1 TaxID=3040204 RepID=UPI0029C78500|nr:DUF309 domain-containing protein [Pleurocapsa sp. FMAR1]
MGTAAKFEQGIAEFNQQQFYACHDTLEAIWVEVPEADKRFYQGILQVAVGCYHLSNGNLRGATILLGEAVRRLYDYQPDYEGVNVELLLEQAIKLLQTLQQLEPEQAQEFFQQLEQKHSAAPQNNLVDGCQMPYIAKV